MSPMLLVDGRRLVRAAGFGLVVFVLAGGGMGFALAASDGGETLAVPEARPGDKVVYTAERILYDADLALGDASLIPLDHVTYQWLPEERVMDVHFGDRLARPLQAQYRYRSGQPTEVVHDRIVYYDAVDGHVLFQQYDTTSQGVVGGPTVWYDDFPVLGDVFIGTQSASLFVADEYHYTRTPCGAGPTPLHGTPYDGSDVVLQGRCGWEAENQVVYAGRGWDETASGSAYRFTSSEDDRLQMWFDSRTPFPVKLTTSTGEITDPRYAVGRMFRLELESFTPGSGAYTDLDPAYAPADNGPLPLAPRTPWLLDDAGMEAYLPLTLQDAYLTALAASTPRSPLAAPHASEWLRSHPNGYLAAAWALEYHDDSGSTLPQWILLWVDGSSWLGKRVSWEAASREVLLPEVFGRHTEVTDWTPSWLPDDVDAAFPDADQVPAAFVRPVDLVEPYFRSFGADALLNRYGFQVYCADQACDRPEVRVEVGRHVEEQPTAGSERDLADSRESFVDKLMVDEGGEAAYRMRYIESTEAILPLDAGSPGPPLAPAAGDGGGGGPAWVAPLAPAAATGVGLVGLAAAALYYFWPSLKGLPLAGLFSRIRDDRVLEHPQRARLLEAIQAEPGVHFQELARRLGLGHGVLEHHVRKLVDADLVVVRRGTGYTCYFPKATDRRMMDAAPMLRSGGSRAVFQAVAEKPGVSSRDLAVHLGLAPSTVSYHLKRLETAGLVLPDVRAGVRLTPLGEQAQAAA